MHTIRRQAKKRSLGFQGIVYALIFTLVSNPVVNSLTAISVATTSTLLLPQSVWAQEFEDAAAEGEAFGRGLIVGPNTDGTQIFFDGEAGVETIDINDLFNPDGSEDDLADVLDAFGSDVAADILSADIQTRLGGEDSAQADAYRTVTESASTRSHPDVINEAWLTRSKDVLDGEDPIFDTFFTGCESVEISDPGSTVHVPEYEYCARVVVPNESCELRHEYEVGLISVAAGEGGTASCGPGCVDLFIGRVGDNYWAGNCTIFEHLMLINVENPDAIISATLEQAVWDDYMQVLLNEELIWSGPNGNFPPETAGRCELETSWNRNLSVDVTDQFQNNASLQFRIRVSVTGGGEGYGRIRLRYDESQLIQNDVWTLDPGCNALFDGITDGACEVTAMTCSDGPDHSIDCININGFELCQDDLAPAPIDGYSELCRVGTVEADCAFFEGDLSCYINTEGVEVCPSNDGGNLNGCANQESRDECVFVESACIPEALGADGRCYAFEEVWDCGYDVGVIGDSTTTVSCDGPIRCMGDECVSQPDEANPDFAAAATRLETLQYMAMDFDCLENDPSTCEVFTGDPMECKIALGGIQDCCDTPTGISLADYLQFAKATYDLANRIQLGERLANAGLNVPGAWEAVSNAGTAVWSTVTRPFTSAWGSLTQSWGGATLEAIEGFSLDALKAQATNVIGQFVAETFGAEIAGLFFEPIVDAGGEAIGYQLNGALSTALGYIMLAYTIYVVINILVDLIWECTQEEFELGAKRELKTCEYVGSYCADDSIFGCIERRRAFCCYHSPLSRIVASQALPQVGRVYGDPEAPDCAGLTIEQLASLDWDLINLDEWYGILASEGIVPDTVPEADFQYSLIESTTADYPGLNAPSAGERIEQRTDAVDFDEARESVRENLWDGI
jgi:conjugal transfer mating pair stabilization protein TraN